MEWSHYKFQTQRLQHPSLLPCPSCGIHHGVILDATVSGVDGNKIVVINLECEFGDKWTLTLKLNEDSCMALFPELERK
jgi:hypothetical protein